MDRRGTTGKGDMTRRGSDTPFRQNKSLWGESPCCDAGLIRLGGSREKLVCEKCGKIVPCET